MEKHKCKICNRRFSNGRALGGHMRSHMAKLPIPPKTQKPDEPRDPSDTPPSELSFMADSVSAVHDRESEAESSRTPAQKRPKWAHRSAEQGSSVSDTTPEEEVALCLMMLSRDKWTIPMKEQEEEEEEEEEDEEEEEEEKPKMGFKDENFSRKQSTKARSTAMYRCNTCKKLFRSYQALGGHRASHKKIRVQSIGEEAGPSGFGENGNNNSMDHRTFECSFCFKVFDSGQALGGHKKVHFSNAATASSSARTVPKIIDLNLPAPQDDDDISHIELSAVSDAAMHHPLII
ncbi:zinc finger protein ZAT9-like [Malania oleifera]|uniref:zinc finger protein ZAT9-like n=1 Tax=Malania oleifera TaxID=397392 RepID=UPI0025AE8821|nr:zinc finger protein ZAT9-like [Malania oleifera]